MQHIRAIGEPPWSREDLRNKLREFAELYKQGPVANNEGGMRSPHMYLVWFALQKLKPKAIIESGVLLGPGTWFFEKACPDAEYLKNNLEIYHEFPPIFQGEFTRWGDPWDRDNYPTPEPLLKSVEEDCHQIFKDEAAHYTWMCYVKLK